MRQGQQNRRGRGRNNNNRGKGHHNPLSRSFESNGPAERIRGTPAHIAEKYLSLARDAQSSGDTVLEQNYLQHAEHYNRIIMAYRDQFNQPHEGGGMNGGGPRGMRAGDLGDSYDDVGDDDMGGDDGYPQPFMQPQQPQPRQERQPGGEHGRPERSDPRSDQRSEQRFESRGDRPERGDRQDRPDRPFRRDRDQGRPPRFGDRDRDRGDRQGFVDRDRQAEARESQGRGDAPERVERVAEPAPEPAAEPPRRRERADRGDRGDRGDRFQQPHEQPEFLRRPVRRVRSTESSNGNGEAPPKAESSGE